jgi:N,N'-diacetyllegionaminate synthase
MGRVLVIAEPGCTAEGRFEDILRLINVAADAGADVFKPQWVSDPARMCERRHIGLDHPKRGFYEGAYRWNSFPLEWHGEFSRLCLGLSLRYACTSFLPEDVAAVDPFVSIHKVASFESQDEEMVRAVEATGKRAVISAGMSSVYEYHYMWHGSEVLHCVSSYPAPPSDMTLRVLREERALYKGLSDHSRNVLTGAVAVGAGAQIIEAHIRLDDTSSGNPDFAAAFSPSEFKVYVDNIRTAELLMGSGEKRLQDCEREMLPYRVTA